MKYLLPLLLLHSHPWHPHAIATHSYKSISSKPQVILSSGTTVSGLVETAYPSVGQFLGIPYAQPPIGSLRWEAPLAANLPESVNATSYGRSCTQFVGTTETVFSKDVTEFNIRDANSTGEDCLTLSIWTPQRVEEEDTKVSRGLPVIVHFYGGGWYTGGQNTPYQIPTQWVQRTQDLIVVVPNFRGNIFGFPNARGVKNQNLGLLDQRLAVEWVRDNIAAFGGDPSKITIWGFSSGGEAVDMYSLAWHKDPIVNGLIMSSGTALIEDGSGPRYSNFSYVASRVGCGNISIAEDELQCMKNVDATVLEDVLAEYHNSGATPGLAFGSSADEKTVFANYTDRVLQGKVAAVPAIIGLSKDDGNVFAPYNVSGADQTISDFWFLNLFLCTSYRTAKARATAGLPTYRYLNAGNFSNLSPRPWMGAYHGSDLPMLFGTHGNFRGLSTEFEIAVSEAMQNTWRAFADDPRKGLAGQGWPQFTLNHDVVRVFGENGTVWRDAVGELEGYQDQC